MREVFKGFYDITQEEEKNIFESKKTIFVFDTNCFLNLYRCEEETKKDFMAVVDGVKERLWFPFHVCLEYQRNRLKVISDSLKGLSEIKNSLGEITKGIDTFCNGDKNIKNKYNILYDKLISLKDGINKSVNDFVADNIEIRINRGDYISNSDDVRRWVDTISRDKLSSPFTQDEIDKINDEGVSRYKNKIGPGWKDESEKGEKESHFNNVIYKDKFGDLYLWNELLRKSSEEDVENIIFVTNDVKEDWWYKVHGKTMGPQEALKTEITNAGLSKFKMYSQSSFVIKCTEIFDTVKVNENSIKEFEMLSSVKKMQNIIISMDNFFDVLKSSCSNENNHLPIWKNFKEIGLKDSGCIDDGCNSKELSARENRWEVIKKLKINERMSEIQDEIIKLYNEYHSIRQLMSDGNDKINNEDEVIQKMDAIKIKIKNLSEELKRLENIKNYLS